MSDVRVRIGRRRSEPALDGDDFSLTRQAALDLARFGVPAGEVEAPAARVEARRVEVREAEVRRLDEAIDDLRHGLGRYYPLSPPHSIDDYVAIVSGFRDPRILGMLADELRSMTVSFDPNQRDLVMFLSRTLGRMRGPEVVPVLAAWMAVVEDDELAGACARALGETGSADAVMPLAAARRRFGSRSPAAMIAVDFVRALPPPSPWPEPRTTDDLLTRAQAHRLREESDEAARRYDRAVEQQPTDPIVRVERADHSLSTGRDGGFDDVLAALRLDPDCAPALVLEGAVYYSEGLRHQRDADLVKASEMFVRALKSLDRAMEIQPVERTGALLNRYNIRRRFASGAADRWRESGGEEDWRQATAHYRAGIDDLTALYALEPWDVNLLGYRATLKRELGSLCRDRASRDGDPAYTEHSLRWFTDALGDADRCVHEAPRWDGFMSRGRIRAMIGDVEAAKADFDAAIDRWPDQPLPYYHLGILLQDSLDRPEEAREAYERFLKLNKDPGLEEEVRRRMGADF